MTLQELIAALEEAADGSDALDRAIAKACNIPWSSDEGGQFGGYGLLPSRVWFTRSLDAALTLLPAPDWEWELSWSSYGAVAKLGDPRLHMEGEHKSPAIALTIAALRARLTP